MALPATDNFNRADLANLGANWTAVINNFQIVSNQAKASSGIDYNCVAWNADSFADDQYAKTTIVTAASSDGGPAVRITGTNLATAKLYFIDARNGSDRLQKLILGTETQVASLSTYLSGDIAELRASGSTVSAFKNGVANGTPTSDSAATTGSAGMQAFGGATPYDDWEGGNIAAAVGLRVSNPLIRRQFMKANPRFNTAVPAVASSSFRRTLHPFGAGKGKRTRNR